MGTNHVFEHIGPAPYTYLGFEVRTYQACPGAPIQVGAACDHCGTGIRDCYNFRAADGKVFVVGSSCVRKSGDRGLYNQIKRDASRIKADRKRERDVARIEAARELFEKNRELFAAEPHSRGFVDRETGVALTFADEIEWMFGNAGVSGGVRTAKRVESFLNKKGA